MGTGATQADGKADAEKTRDASVSRKQDSLRIR